MSTIRRSPRSQRFDNIDQRIVRDQRLSYRARGVLIRLLSNEDDFPMDAKDLAREGKEGRTAILSALKELRVAGYLVIKRCQNRKGHWNTESIVYDVPQLGEKNEEIIKPKSRNRTSVSRTPVDRMSESSTLTEQRGEQLKKNNNSVGCCFEAQDLILSSKAKLDLEEQQYVQKSISHLHQDEQIQLIQELIRQRSEIKNTRGWMVKMVNLSTIGGFKPAPSRKKSSFHTHAEKIEQGKEIWQGLNLEQRNQLAIMLERYLNIIDCRCLALKQLRKYGIEHKDVSNDLYIFLAENPKADVP